MTENALNGYHIYNSFLSGFLSIRKEREHINSINVFPVADGDTGNNLVRTIKLIVSRLKSDRSASKVLNDIAELSLESARGNSGIIFSQYLNGLAINTNGKDTLTIHDFAEAAQKAVLTAYEAMENPVEGTILTVLSAWSNAIYSNSSEKTSLEQVFEKALATARVVLGKTKEQLPVLKDNDVVDAGAMGVISFLEGVELMRFQGPIPIILRKSLGEDQHISGIFSTPTSHKTHSDLKYRYCTEILIDHPRISTKNIKNKLKDHGDSLIVSKGLNKSRIHIHSNRPQDIVEIMRKYGSLVEQKADDMFRQEQSVNSPISSTAILTDSIADIPLEILDKYQIHVLNLKLNWDEEEYIDKITITPEHFYKMQQTRGSFPGSSLPTESMISTTYQYLTDHYKNLLVLSVSKALSGTCTQMEKVAEVFNKDEKRITVINTCLNSVAQGLLVQEIGREAAKGTSCEKLIELAEDLKKRIKIYVSVSTFKFMVKGGRVSPLKGFLASFLNLKPIISLDENGKGRAFDKAFSQKGLTKKIIRIIEETEKHKGIESYAIVQADAEEKAEYFSEMIKSTINKSPDYISEISPIVGMHSGKGAIAIAVLEKNL